MAQVINTNIGSIIAQVNLDRTNDLMQTSLTRLSSGLRINSAKDDAAGLAISTRFGSQIQGSEQAQRNANDAISVAQLAEGALSETTNLLQRIRQLAVQSANASYSSADRLGMQTEVNQLVQEITRIGTTAQFNSVNLLDGTFVAKNFQIGPNQYQTVSVSIQDSSSDALGANQIKSSNAHGIEQAVNNVAFVGAAGSATGGLSATVGARQAGLTNGYAAADSFTFTFTTAAGGLGSVSSAQTTANDSAESVAAGISAALQNIPAVTANGYARGFNAIQLSNFNVSATDAAAAVNLYYRTGAGSAAANTIALASGSGLTLSAIAAQINANTTLQSAGIYAVYGGSAANTVNVYSNAGADLAVSLGGTVTLNTASLVGTSAGTAALASGSTACYGGRVDLFLPQGCSVSEANGQFYNTQFLNSANTNTSGVLYGGILTGAGTGAVAGLSYTPSHVIGNGVGAQNVTVAGPFGSTGSNPLLIAANQTASSIADAVNGVSGETGVSATARTTLSIGGLTLLTSTGAVASTSTPGAVSFSLMGDNTSPVQVTASLSSANDLTPLVTAINGVTSATNVVANIGSSTSTLNLTLPSGKNIALSGLTIGWGQGFQNPAQAPVQSDGSTTVAAPQEAYLVVTGNPGTDAASQGVRLYSGGAHSNQNSTVVGGQVLLSATAGFSASSSIDGLGNSGFSLFSAGANLASASSLLAVNQINVTTADNAELAILIADSAIDIINSNRAGLGAVQSRFNSTVRSLDSSVVNLNEANSRILDADFASETANLSKAQILQQAGIAVLAQANALPQQILALLH